MLINCVAYQKGNKLSSIPVEDISDHIQKPDCFVWVALKDASPEELKQLNWKLLIVSIDENKDNKRLAAWAAIFAVATASVGVWEMNFE